MAKKAKGKKPPKKNKPRDRKPARQEVMPGMEQIRNGKLDRLCESIGHAQEESNRLIEECNQDKAAALAEMMRRDIHGYVHMGVRLTAKKGVDKLGVKLLKDKTEHGAQVGSEAELEPAGETTDLN